MSTGARFSIRTARSPPNPPPRITTRCACATPQLLADNASVGKTYAPIHFSMLRSMSVNVTAERRRLEWEALCALCASFGDAGGARRLASVPLQEAQFLDTVHRVLFIEIARCYSCCDSQEQFQRRLPEAMTRLGFPDLDFDALFRARSADSAHADISTLARQLARTSGAPTETEGPS